jgi:hypothetical protein
VDFGVLRDNNGDVKSDDNRTLKGVHPEGETLTLDSDTAAPLLEAGVIKPSGEEAVATDQPEEHGYAGEAQRKEAQTQNKSRSAARK